jgi:uncharacterized protein YyaL (SSP411 family)
MRDLIRSLSLLMLASMLTACSPRKPAAPVPSSNSTNTVSTSTNSTAAAKQRKHTNRLAKEKSPYLLQHAHNPVDWFPWGEEAFAKARKDNKPILLSIGYSTCHWCHVMERESFENEDVAKFLNENFVSIKVDREERPDVDKIYMTAVQAMGQGGGWPLNAFLTPDLKPFFGGTYFPPEPKFGRPSFMQMLQRISLLWQSQAADIKESAAQIHKQLAEATSTEPSPDLVVSREALTNAMNLFLRHHDPVNGGFGRAPKFPRPSQPAFLLRAGVRFGDTNAVRAVLHTCQRMAAGGIYDHVGGGFARYSVDEKWLVPHFEKMLYDNAQLAHLFLDAHLVTGDIQYADVARDILRYVLRDMTHPDGGFYSAEDADSEGHEGKFYCWTKAELAALLTADELKLVIRRFGVTEEGNFEDHSHPQPLKKQNVLSIVDAALAPEQVSTLASAMKKMFEHRAKRIRPHLDDKILASWNGLMLGAIARASVVLDDPALRRAAEKNVAFLQAKLWDAPTKTLFHRWRDGERDTTQFLDTYAFLADGVLHLYEATLDPRHLEFSLELAETMLAKFHDPGHGGFFQSPKGAGDLILRVKEEYDGAEPAGNSVAALVLMKLSAITDRKDLRKAAESSVRLYAHRILAAPQVVPYLLLATDWQLEEPRRAVLAGDPASTPAAPLLRAVHGVYQPNKVVLGTTGPVEPFAKTLPPKDGPVLYICTGTECKAPTKVREEILGHLK